MWFCRIICLIHDNESNSQKKRVSEAETDANRKDSKQQLIDGESQKYWNKNNDR